MSLLFRVLRLFTALLAAMSFMFGQKGETFEVSFYSNPSSGYTWICESDDEKVIKPEGSRYEKDDGSILSWNKSGKEIFTLRTGKAGVANVTFKYVRVLSPSSTPISVHVYTYKVTRNGKAKLIRST